MRLPKYLTFPLSKEASAFWLAFGAGAISAVGLLLAYANPFNVQVEWSFKFVELLSAIGTVAAAVVATWLGISGMLRESRRAHDSALLIAAALLPRLKLVLSDVHTAALQLEFSERPDPNQDVEKVKRIQDSDLAMVNDIVMNPVFTLSSETVRDLTHLPNNAAHRLMMGFAYVNNIRSTHFGKDGEWRWHRYDPMVRYRVLASMGVRLTSAEEYLKLSIAEMEKAVSSAGIEPTPEELYGGM